MLREVSRIAKHTGIYGLGVVLSKSVGFILIPLYTHYLKPADYGTLELLDLIAFLASNFCSLGVFSAVFRFYAAYDHEQDKKEVISTALLFITGLSLLISLTMIVLAPRIAAAVFGNASYAHLVRVTSLTLFFSNLTEVPLAYWRMRERSVLFVMVGLLRTGVGAGMMVTAVAVLQKGVLGAVYAGCISNALFGLATSGVILLEIPRRIVSSKLKEMLKYGLPIVPWALNLYVLAFADRFFLRHFGTLGDVGVYALGYKLAMIVSLLVSGPFAMLWQWHQFELAKQKDAKTLYARIQLYVLLASAFVALGVALFAKDVVRIALCYVLENVRAVVMSGILVKQATRSLIWIGAVVASSNLLLNYVLISRYMAMGAAVATLLSYVLNLALCHHSAQGVYPVRYDYARNALALGAAGLICLASQWIELPLLPSILLNTSLMLLYAVIAAWILNQEERTMFQQIGVAIASRMRSVLARAD